MMKSLMKGRSTNNNRAMDTYKMNHPKRGAAVIFNLDDLPTVHSELHCSRRGTGSKTDCINLEKALKKLKFDVEVEHNLAFKEIDKKLVEVRNRDHQDHDCLVIAILTYGHKGRLHSFDRMYELDELIEHFIASKCPSLAGKPKIFIVQACELPIKRAKRDLTETDSLLTHLIPNHADFLIEYSTVPGSFAWSGKENSGSWFIDSLCAELNERAKKYDFLTLLTIVKQRVDREYQMFLRDPSNKTVAKIGVPITTYMLTRKLLFK